ncbi:DNA-directed RNA polymerase subunit alpha C-terminal domain-containing protein [Nonomuraea recticatena]|uniref:RNA polymerase alpha subunit C-terminal domain-containing protein n=1 Tax=Nonomuraea recticatena TaxID=46178 RepID=A0ABP6FUS2_9ACTN
MITTSPTPGSVADLVAKAGLPDNHPIKELPGLTWHATNPLKDAQPPILTLDDLAARTDNELLQIPGFGGRRLDAVKAAIITASEGR